MFVLKIKLTINDKEKEFITPFISARKLRDTFKVQKKIENGEMNETTIDEMADYIVDIFGNKFTQDELLDGLEGNMFMPTFTECVQNVLGQTEGKINQFPKVE